MKHVPVRAELLAALCDAGFRQIVLTKFGPTPVLPWRVPNLRETMIEAHS